MTIKLGGRFWAIGVGPGDPELLTLKGVNVLRRAHVLYHAGPQEQQGRAWDIMRGFVHPEQQIKVVLTEPMHTVSAAADWKPYYREGVERIAADCRQGLDVAFVAEGDPTLYSTAAYVWQLLAELHPEISQEIVPGVSSVTAAAARVGWPLAQRDETLLIAPAGNDDGAGKLQALIGAHPHACLLKVSAAFPQVLEALKECGPGCEAVYVENLGTDQEWITHDLPSAAGRDRYFSLILVRRVDPSRRASAMPAGRTGKVWVVGLGPGEAGLLTPHARRILHQVQDIVGYEGYLKPLESFGLRGSCHASPIGAETERAKLALELAQAGRHVALVSSGDAGVYGMASLLLETAEGIPEVEIEVIPGITAATAAAARLGAPLGHDFACVSLSDLLTPWEVIERRLEAAGQGDFVLALYNPISERRTWQLPRAREVLLRHRQPETPVGLVTAAYRPGMQARLTTLDELTTEGVSMQTTLIIGNSRTRIVHGRMVTPRGYGGRT